MHCNTVAKYNNIKCNNIINELIANTMLNKSRCGMNTHTHTHLPEYANTTKGYLNYFGVVGAYVPVNSVANTMDK